MGATKGLVALAAVLVAAACGSSGSGGGAGPDGGGSSSSSGGSSGSTGSSGGSSGGSSSSGGGGSSGGPGGCLGSDLLSWMGTTRLVVGGSMADQTATMAPFDLRYDYLAGGLFPGSTPCASCQSGCNQSWWGCWQDPAQPPGAYVRNFAATCAAASPPQVPMITYYEILQASGVPEGKAEVTKAANDPALMTRYFNDWRFVLQQIGMGKALLHIEPDFWGYAEQAGPDPTMLAAAVASANATDCASQPNTIAGMGKCMVAMVRKYAPNAKVGLQASAWSTNIDVALNSDPSLDVAGEAKKTAAFLTACGQGDADFVVVETSDRDAGYYQSQGRNTWWDATNAKIPDFAQDFAWVKALTEALGKPALYWQTPLGNAAQNDTTNHWKDNRVDTFFAHMDQLAGAHAVGAAFGAGAGDQTTPESDGGNLVSKVKAYVGAGGQKLCP